MRILKTLIISFVLSGVLLVGTPLSAQEGDSVLNKAWEPNKSSEAIQGNPFLKQLFDNGVELVPLGHEQGFDGWLTIKDDQIQVFYTIPNHDGVLTGLLIGPKGENLTAYQLARYEATSGQSVEGKLKEGEQQRSSKALSPGEVMMAETSQAVWFGFGGEVDNLPPYLYVFASPDCDDCKAYFDQLLDPYAKDNMVQVRIVPVYQDENDQRLIEQILSSDKPAKTWVDVVLDDKNLEEQVVTDRVSQEVQINKMILDKRKLSALPLTLYKNGAGDVKIVQGVPEDIQSMILDLTVKN